MSFTDYVKSLLSFKYALVAETRPDCARVRGGTEPWVSVIVIRITTSAVCIARPASYKYQLGLTRCPPESSSVFDDVCLFPPGLCPFFFLHFFIFVQGCALSRHRSFNSSSEQCVPSHRVLLRSRSSPLPLRLASAVSHGRSVRRRGPLYSCERALTEFQSDNGAL